MADCAYIPEVAYSQFSLKTYRKMMTERHPMVGSLELTFRCNLRCQHCYVSHGHTGIPGQQELTTQEIKNILDQVTDAGTLWFLFTGGEPLMRPDFAELYTYAKQKGLLHSLFTNATMLTERTADVLAEWRPFSIEVTMYGYTQKTYERVTGIPGSYALFRRGIEMLLERKLPLKLKTMVMSLNQHELNAMSDYARSLGCSFRFDAMLNEGLQTGKGCGHPRYLRLTPQEVAALDATEERRMAWQEFLHRFESLKPDTKHLYQCAAGMTSYHIDPYGHLSLCMLARNQSYDLRQGAFREGWQFLTGVRDQPPQHDYRCNQCELKLLCNCCPGWSQLEHGDPQMAIDYQCQVALGRARVLNYMPQEQLEQTVPYRVLADRFLSTESSSAPTVLVQSNFISLDQVISFPSIPADVISMEHQGKGEIF